MIVIVREICIKCQKDGREICNLRKANGKWEYRWRVYQMLRRQNLKCCNCKYQLLPEEATFEHEFGRTAGKRDDRVERDGNPINGASHLICNQHRGSKKIPIWHGPMDDENCGQ